MYRSVKWSMLCAEIPNLKLESIKIRSIDAALRVHQPDRAGCVYVVLHTGIPPIGVHTSNSSSFYDEEDSPASISTRGPGRS